MRFGAFPGAFGLGRAQPQRSSRVFSNMVPEKGVDLGSHVCLKLAKTLRLQLSGSDMDT